MVSTTYNFICVSLGYFIYLLELYNKFIPAINND